MAAELSGKIQTVTGCIDPKDLGITLTHEHLTNMYDVAFQPPFDQDEGKQHVPFSLENASWIRQYPYSHHANLKNQDREAVIEEMKMFKANGGGTIVDNTTHGLVRDMQFLKDVSEKTGVNVVAGAGFYFDESLPKEIASKTSEQLAQTMIQEVLESTEGTGVKCGFIGEIGCSFPLTATEKKVLYATAEAQNTLSCAVNIHPGRTPESAFQIMRIMQEAGADVSKICMSHLDRTIHKYSELVAFAEIGTYLEYDLFGIEVGHYQKSPNFFMPNDGERINRIHYLIQEGYNEKIVIAHDVHTLHRLTKYGGHGYSHILRNVVPMMKNKGISQDDINNILINNPKHWLTFK